MGCKRWVAVDGAEFESGVTGWVERLVARWVAAVDGGGATGRLALCLPGLAVAAFALVFAAVFPQHSTTVGAVTTASFGFCVCTLLACAVYLSL